MNIRKHAASLNGYIQTLEAQVKLTRPKAVSLAMDWLGSLLETTAEPIKAPSLPPVQPWAPPYVPRPPLHRRPDRRQEDREMTRPTQAQIDALLALPLPWRRRLAEVAREEPGWWVSKMSPAGRLLPQPEMEPYSKKWSIEEQTSRGWAYAPCCGLVWLRAMGMEWEACGDDGVMGFVAFFGLKPIPDPIDAFLAYAVAHPCPEATP